MPTFDPYRVQCNDISINVVDLQFFDADPELDSDFHFFADPDPTFHFNPVLQIRIPTRSDANLQTWPKHPSRLH
jgi:hypothetical protein